MILLLLSNVLLDITQTKISNDAALATFLINPTYTYIYIVLLLAQRGMAGEAFGYRHIITGVGGIGLHGPFGPLFI